MARLGRVILDLDAQTADVDVYDLQLAHIVMAPHHLQQLVARKRLADVLHERLEQTVLDLRQLDLASVLEHLACAQIELERTGLDDVLLRERRAGYAAVQRVHARDQLDARKRLGHIVVRAVHQTVYLVRLLRARGQHDHAGLIALCTHRAADLVAVDARQHDVEYRDREILIFTIFFERLLAGFSLDDLVAAPFHIQHQKGADAFFILQNQYLTFHRCHPPFIFSCSMPA